MTKQQRLVICFDGTWNNQDDSTNVLHHYNLVCEGEFESWDKIVTQKKYYHRGVGTGVLDQISGGGFGFGLEANVRDAYNWLVEQYQDDDEIYIFGFSRGAYTARSLVGFIGRCGLLRRAAPLMVSQLWQDYCVLGREREERPIVWDTLFGGVEQPKVRQITDLVPDPWQRNQEARSVPASASEKLLVAWSRRVRITYLGVYDTVGALGWDALAIPGLRSKLAMHHNMRPTTLMQHCRHALAIHENRSSFDHTPFLAYAGHGTADDPEITRGVSDPSTNLKYVLDRTTSDAETGGALSERDKTRQRWTAYLAMWREKIEQRWFVGAHSNIGGGYPDNILAQEPFIWLLEGAVNLGLECEAVATPRQPLSQTPAPTDSFAQFVPLVWTKILRAKRNYRRIDPERVYQAAANPNAPETADGRPAPGFSLESINEHVDESAWEYFRTTQQPLPPNLHEYRQRGHGPSPWPVHPWLGTDWGEHIALVLWATMVAAGLAATYKLIRTSVGDEFPPWIICLVCFLAPLVDWGESRVNFLRAAGWGGPRSRAFLDAIYWTRTFGVVLFFCGAVYAIVYLLGLGWDPPTPALAFAGLTHFLHVYWRAPICAGVSVAIAGQLEGMSFARLKPAAVALIGGAGIALAVVALVVGVGQFAHSLFRDIAESVGLQAAAAGDESKAGLLLLLQFAFFYLLRAIPWCEEPMTRANLGSIVPLQLSATPARVANCFKHWIQMLECRWLEEDPATGPAARRMQEVVGETLWRDIIGYIPVYTAVFIFGLWFSSRYWLCALDEDWNGIPWWLVIPLVAATADYGENVCHLRYLKLHAAGKNPWAGLALFSFLLTCIKFLAALVALTLTMAAMLGASFEIFSAGAGSWRDRIALLVTVAYVFVGVGFITGRVVYWLFGKKPE